MFFFYCCGVFFFLALCPHMIKGCKDRKKDQQKLCIFCKRVKMYKNFGHRDISKYKQSYQKI